MLEGNFKTWYNLSSFTLTTQRTFQFEQTHKTYIYQNINDTQMQWKNRAKNNKSNASSTRMSNKSEKKQVLNHIINVTSGIQIAPEIPATSKLQGKWDAVLKLKKTTKQTIFGKPDCTKNYERSQLVLQLHLLKYSTYRGKYMHHCRRSYFLKKVDTIPPIAIHLITTAFSGRFIFPS